MDEIKYKKNLGQNFLKNDSVLNDIISSFEVNSDSQILEVGAGSGVLTKKLISFGVHVVSFEIDQSLKPFLDKLSSSNLDIIYKDFLSIKLQDYVNDKKQLLFIANVPYYITTPIINKFIDENVIPDTMILLIQKEVAERISAKSGSKKNGSITILLNYFFNIKYLFDVDRNNFIPVPNVDSAVIKLKKRDNLLFLNDYDKFKEVVYNSFIYKRKNLKNNLGMYNLEIVESILKKYGYSLKNRAEDLNYEIYVELSNNL